MSAEPRPIEAELLGCPVCGGRPIAYTIPPHEHNVTGLLDMPPFQGAAYIECGDCELTMMDDEAFDIIERWNKRA